MTKSLVYLLCVVTFVGGLIIGSYLLPILTRVEQDTVSTTVSDAGVSEEDLILWTCSMHPQIQQPEPGNCPICGMELIPVRKEVERGGEPSRGISMSDQARALAEIRTTEVRYHYPETQVRMVGTLQYDETRMKSLTARFPARIDELYVNFTGIRVQAGEHLAKVYSPELLTAQQELLSAHSRNPNSTITKIAREKLRLWDLLPDQIDSILWSGKARDHFILRAPIGGVVVTKKVKEGDYVKTGESLLQIADLSELWLFLDAYESELALLRYGQDVAFTVEAFPGKSFHGRIAFIEPEVDRKTRTVSVRVNVPNRDGRLKPGMFARGAVVVKLGRGGEVYAPELTGKWISPMHPEVVKDGPGRCDVCGMPLVSAESLGYAAAENLAKPLIIPASAVLRTGRRAVVYVAVPNADRPTYEGREIVLGLRAGDVFIVNSGLVAGEQVVSNGAFKIDSALQIQAKPSMMNPQGGGLVPGHDHDGSDVASGSSESSQQQHGQSTAPTESNEQQDGVVATPFPGDLAAKLITPYLVLQAALAGDDLAAAKESVRGMLALAGHTGALADQLHGMLAAESLGDMRMPYFFYLSEQLIASFKAHPSAHDHELLIMHCPMFGGGRGADWLQVEEPLRNPYYGTRMLTCGEIKDKLTPTTTGYGVHDH